MMKLYATWACLILSVSAACSLVGRSNNSTLQQPEAKSTHNPASAASSDPLTSKFFEGNPKGAASWREFLNGGRYRLAAEQDFRFSDPAKKNLKDIFGEEWKSRAFNPYTGGEINHDKYYHDIAFIVIDNARTDSNRFGLVILNEQPNDVGHKLYWLYRERDLSSTVFGWASDGLRLHEYDEQGQRRTCRVSWNELQQEYRCKTT